MNSLPTELIVKVAERILPHAHLYALSAASRRFRDAIRDGFPQICQAQIERILPHMAIIDPPDPPLDAPLILRAERYGRSVRSIHRAVRHIAVLDAHPEQFVTLRGLDTFVVRFTLSEDRNLSGCMRFDQNRVTVEMTHAKAAVHNHPCHSWVMHPFQAPGEQDHVMYIALPLLDVDERGCCTHPYLAEDGLNDMRWCDTMSEVASCACTPQKFVDEAYNTDAVIDVAQYACLSNQRVLREFRITGDEHSTFVRAHVLNSNGISPRLLQGFDYGDQIGLLWAHMLRIERCAFAIFLFCENFGTV